MIQKKLHPDDISKILKDNFNDNNSIFIFPTNIVMDSWINYIVTQDDYKNKAVAFERFTAWDNFKRDFVSAKQEGKTVIPTILRKMFVTNFIVENAKKDKKDRLQKIINPDDVYVKEADSFTDWLTHNLVTLHFWKKRTLNHPEYKFDEEDKDYDALYNAYSKFLEDNNLFESAWVDDIDFNIKDKKFHIFYPELLEDFTDYKDIFSKIENIITYSLPSDIDKPLSYFYPDSRSELRQTILSMINLVQSGKADWSDIVLSVPNLDIYRPYIDREFSLYGIPYVIKAGISLTKNSSGKIFREIYDCYNDNFSFNSIRNLLLDECVPWQDKYIKLIEDLIREGSKMRCICTLENKDGQKEIDVASSVDKVTEDNDNSNQGDIWDKALRGAISKEYQNIEYYKDNEEEKIKHTEKRKNYYNLLHFYTSVKDSILKFFPSKPTFRNILVSWMNFKRDFLKNDKDFSSDANNILSRCITHLNEIIEIEKKYEDCNLCIPSPFSFYLSELDKKTYTKQTKKSGVTVFPYRLSSAAYFKYQFVIDASQKNLDISYKRLTFLNNNKRKQLGLDIDDKTQNAGEVFIKLYAKNTTGEKENCVHFSASENTFNGFAIPHSTLKVKDDKNENDTSIKALNFDDEDYILNEKNVIRENENAKPLTYVTKNQIDSFNEWKKSHIEKDLDIAFSNNIKDSILTHLKNRRTAPTQNDKIKITARGDLEKFFPCPRKWLLQSVLKIEEDTLDTRLMQPYDMGNLNHKILELFMSRFINKKLPYFDVEQNEFFLNDKIKGQINYTNEIDSILYGKDNSQTLCDQALKELRELKYCPMVKYTLLSQKAHILLSIKSFLKCLLIPYSGRPNGETKKIKGIGNCIALKCEYHLDTGKYKDEREDVDAINERNLSSTEDKDFDYYGIIDFCVETDDDEKDIIIVDYKNSSSAIPSTTAFHVNDKGILKDFQMSVYFNLIKSNTIDRHISTGIFYGIKDCKSTGTNKIPKKDEGEIDEELCDTRDVLNDYATIFIDHIKNSNFTPLYSWSDRDKMNVKNYKDCASCSFKSICRTTYQVAKKNIKQNPDKILNVKEGNNE